MTNLAEQFRARRRTKGVSSAVKPAVDTSATQAISPQDFYRELTEREDVQRILMRLAQVKDGQR